VGERNGQALTGLAKELVETWAQQGRDGFLLSDPEQDTGMETRTCKDGLSGVGFRFRWLPHRELRGNVQELIERGIINPDHDKSQLFVDPRDPSGRHCFLCEQNIRIVHPKERLVPLTLAGQEYFAGANFAWIELDHFTVFSKTHQDQAYSEHTLPAMIDLHRQTDGRFRVLFNGPGAGATIPWHLHYQITTEAMPVEALNPGGEVSYPTSVQRYKAEPERQHQAHEFAAGWVARDPENHTVNVLIAPGGDEPMIYIFPRDQRHAKAENKGLVGGFEMAGDFVMSAPAEREPFENATADLAIQILQQVCPPPLRRNTR
jgi:hypothetical protein